MSVRNSDSKRVITLNRREEANIFITSFLDYLKQDLNNGYYSYAKGEAIIAVGKARKLLGLFPKGLKRIDFNGNVAQLQDRRKTARLYGMLREVSRGNGNFNIGSGTREEAREMGAAWVGKGARLSSNGKAWISHNGMRQYRPPAYKNKKGHAQANFEKKIVGQRSKGWQTNGHFDID
ncbi:MAG: hypothetical protein HRT70_08605 [Flavobacteriaceae bacterium]|nr:hypothetical protein [Flavobacteriaceae bacterium]